MNEREVARQILDELLRGALSGAANGNGGATPVPQVPAPPVAAVLRPSTWNGPPAAGEVIGDARREGGDAESVAIRSDADLQRFVAHLLARFEDPAEREAIRSGRRRFTLRADGAAPAGGTGVRVEHGAVTERTVAKAATAGGRLVLGPRAVLTPLAREKARALGIEIEREHRC